MKISKMLETYSVGTSMDTKTLDLITNEFKDLIIEIIYEKYLLTKISDQKTRDVLRKNISKLITQEHNTLTIHHYNILENLNLCIEVEMSDKIVKNESNDTFGKYKFSDILERGISEKEQINRFEISESKFLTDLEDVIRKFTNDVSIGVDSILIEFN
jgi:hypothetical protein